MESTRKANEVRIDKWLWAVRIYKTRTVAADACKGGHVTVNGQRVKPAHTVKLNEIISARTGIITRTIKVLGLIERRVGAPLAKAYAEDLTPSAEFEKAKAAQREPFFRYEGFGRPTKKNRRAMQEFLGD